MRAVIFGYFGTLTDPGAEEYREPLAHRTGELLGGCRPRFWEALAGSFGERTIGVHGGTESTLRAVALSCGANPSSTQLPVALAHHRSGHARLRKPRHHALGVLAELRRRGFRQERAECRVRGPYYSGKHRRHGVNVQVIADPVGRLIWASPALPGGVHDLTAARTHAVIDALTRGKVVTFADKAYQGARGSIRNPFKRHRYRPKLTPWEKKVNRAHARIRGIGERANATLKVGKVLTRLRCSPHRATPIVQAILVLHHVENPAHAG